MSTEEATFQAIKKVFTTVLVIQHFDSDKNCIVEENALNYITAAILSQPDHESILQPITFML